MNGECAHCGDRFEAVTSRRLYCSETCRKLAHKRRERDRGSGPVTFPGRSTVDAVRALVEELEAGGWLAGFESSATICLNLAAACDADPRNSALWAQLRAAERVLVDLRTDDGDDELSRLLDRLSGFGPETTFG